MRRATVFAPGSIGNVGPGFDVLGLAVEDIGDRVTVELIEGEARIESITGRDAELIPSDPARNTAAVAARAWLREAGIAGNPLLTIVKGLPLAGGLGGSGASSAAGAYAAALAAGANPTPEEIISAALEAEQLVSGRHLDNIAASVLGGLVLVRSVDPIDVIALPFPTDWRVVLVTPRVRIETAAARSLLPETWDRRSWTQQMANTAALVHAFSDADRELLRRCMDDLYAEPVRASLIPRFQEMKGAALDAGALGCSISGSGPTVFAIVEQDEASRCAAEMRRALGDVECDMHLGAIATEGVREE